jgi:polysaccharide export outer membrane protein
MRTSYFPSGWLACLITSALAAGVLPAQEAAPSFPETTPVPETRVGPGDLLEIQVMESAEMSRQARVSAGGLVQLPLVGEFLAAGLTTSQLGAKIASLLEAQLLQNPHVSVLVLESQAEKITVLGAVSNPGRYQVDGTTRLLDAVFQAGGVTQSNRGTATLIRPGHGEIAVDLQTLLAGQNLEENVLLQPGDIINVIAVPKIDVYVFGEVGQPGWFQIDADTTLMRLISLAGGTSGRAAVNKIKIFRETGSGKLEEMRADLDKILKGEAEDLILMPNDRVVVPKTFF